MQMELISDINGTREIVMTTMFQTHFGYTNNSQTPRATKYGNVSYIPLQTIPTDYLNHLVLGMSTTIEPEAPGTNTLNLSTTWCT